MNTPVQGTAADLIKRAMAGGREASPRLRPGPLQVHDELMLEVPEDQLEDIRQAIVSEMEAVAELAVPLKVETGHGRSWDAAH